MAAVDVNRLAPDLRLVLASQLEGIVLVPMRNIDWITEDRTQELGQRPGIAHVSVEFTRRFRNQRRTLRAYRTKKFGMRKCEPESSISAHGKSGDASRPAFADHAIVTLDVWQKLVDKKVAVAIASVGRVDKKTATSFRRNHKEIANLVIAPQVFD